MRRKATAFGVRAQVSVGRRRIRGLLSVVVPAYRVEAYLEECLASIQGQDHHRVEIIVVDDGSPDRVAEITRARARRDPRIRLVQRENGGLSAARNTGIDHARGEFLTFVDSDDVVSDVAFSAPLAALAESGSDFALTHYDRIRSGEHTPAGGWIGKVHERRRLGATLADFPEAMVNAVAWSKVYRRDFWDRAGLRFAEGTLYEDQPVSAAAFGSARAFDVVPEIGVSWRVRDDESSISQTPFTAANLAAHNLAVAASLDELRRTGHQAAVTERILQLLANNMKFFTRPLARSDQDFRSELGRTVRDLVEHVPEQRLIHEVDGQDKVLFRLIMDDRMDEAVDFLDRSGWDARQFPTVRTERGFRALVPYADSVPAEWALLSDRQLDLSARVLRTHVDGGRLYVSGWAHLRSIDLAEHPPSIVARMVGGDAEVRMTVQQHAEARVARASDHSYCDFRPGGFTASLALDELPDLPTASTGWRLELDVEAGGVRRTGRVTESSTAGASAVAHSVVHAGGVVHTLQQRARPGDRGPVLTRRQEEVWARIAVTEGDELVIQLGDGPEPDELLIGEETAARDGEFWVFEAETLPRAGRVRARMGRRLVDVLASPETPLSPLRPEERRHFSAAADGTLELADRDPVATAVGATDGSYTLEVGMPAQRVTGQLLLRGREGGEVSEFIGHNVAVRADGTATAEIGAEALPPGRYDVSLIARDGTSWPLRPAAELLRLLPLDASGPHHDVAWEIAAEGRPSLVLELRASDQTSPRGANTASTSRAAERPSSSST